MSGCRPGRGPGDRAPPPARPPLHIQPFPLSPAAGASAPILATLLSVSPAAARMLFKIMHIGSFHSPDENLLACGLKPVCPPWPVSHLPPLPALPPCYSLTGLSFPPVHYVLFCLRTFAQTVPFSWLLCLVALMFQLKCDLLTKRPPSPHAPHPIYVISIPCYCLPSRHQALELYCSLA